MEELTTDGRSKSDKEDRTARGPGQRDEVFYVFRTRSSPVSGIETLSKRSVPFTTQIFILPSVNADSHTVPVVTVGESRV